MQFTVPQFIERETPIVGPFSFKQIVFIGVGGALTLGLYFFIENKMFFILLALVINGLAFALALYKKDGFPLTEIIQKSLIFLGRPKIYLWQRKTIPPRGPEKANIKNLAKEEEEESEESPLKIAGKSRLKKLNMALESKTG